MFKLSYIYDFLVLTIHYLQGYIFINSGVTLDRETNEVPHDQEGRAAYTFGVSATDGGNPTQQTYTTVC